jgi:hypothetical protein
MSPSYQNQILKSSNTTVEPILLTTAKELKAASEHQADKLKTGIIDRADHPDLLLSDIGNLVITAQDTAVSTVKPFDIFPGGHYVLDFLFVAILLAFTYGLLIASPKQ